MELRDCTWCGSAASIEYGVCQVCLMHLTEDEPPDRIVVALPFADIEVEEEAGREAAAAE